MHFLHGAAMPSVMRKTQILGLSAALFLLVFVAPRSMPAQAGQESAIRMEVTEYGLYTADEQGCTRDDQGIQRCERANIRHAATTLTVPAQRGVQFGVKFRVFGSPAGANPTSAIRGFKERKLLILLGRSTVGLHHNRKEIRRFSSYHRW